MIFDEIALCDSVSSKADFIKKQAANGPVLVYCEETLTTALKLVGCEPLLITEDVDSGLLRNLDKVSEAGFYKVLTAQNQFAMRGYDYRSPNCQIALVIGRSFEN